MTRSTGFPSSTATKTAVDLFAGCGGLTLGLKRAVFRVLGAVDIDSLSTETYQANHKGVTVWEMDVRGLDPAEILSTLALKKGDLDLLAGCTPCQGFSTLRTLNASFEVDDPRNNREKIEARRRHYIAERPHGALGNLAPKTFALKTPAAVR